MRSEMKGTLQVDDSAKSEKAVTVDAHGVEHREMPHEAAAAPATLAEDARAGQPFNYYAQQQQGAAPYGGSYGGSSQYGGSYGGGNGYYQQQQPQQPQQPQQQRPGNYGTYRAPAAGSAGPNFKLPPSGSSYQTHGAQIPVPGAPCTVPMWKVADFVCTEADQADPQDYWQDSQGNDRINAPDGGACTVRCPASKWYQKPDVTSLMCVGGIWSTNTTDGRGRSGMAPASAINCKTARWVYIVSGLSVVAVIGVLLWYRHKRAQAAQADAGAAAAKQNDALLQPPETASGSQPRLSLGGQQPQGGEAR